MKKKNTKDEGGQSPSLDFAIYEVDNYRTKWLKLKSKVEALLNGGETFDDADPETLKKILFLIDLVENGEPKTYDYNVPRYFCDDDYLDITHEQISEAFDK